MTRVCFWDLVSLNFEFDGHGTLHEYSRVGGVFGHVLVYSLNQYRHEYRIGAVSMESRLVSNSRMLKQTIPAVASILQALA